MLSLFHYTIVYKPCLEAFVIMLFSVVANSTTVSDCFLSFRVNIYARNTWQVCINTQYAFIRIFFLMPSIWSLAGILFLKKSFRQCHPKWDWLYIDPQARVLNYCFKSLKFKFSAIFGYADYTQKQI